MTTRIVRRLLPAVLLLALVPGLPSGSRFAHAADPAASTGDAPPPAEGGTIFRYSNPAGGNEKNYALQVLRRGPEFTENELLRWCDDVYPLAGKNPELMLRYMVERKGWESDRVYYMMAKTFLAEAGLAATAQGKTPPTGGADGMAATAGELELVRRHHDRIPAAFGGGRRMDNPTDPACVANAEASVLDPFADDASMRAVIAGNPEFSEDELTRALADIAGGERDGSDKLTETLRQKGWDRNRAFYMVFRIRVGYIIMTDKNSRKAFEQEFRQALPTPSEEAIMKKHLPELKAARFIR